MSEEAVSLEAWNKTIAQATTITTEELDGLARKYQAKYDEYEAAKSVASDLYKEAEDLEAQLINALESCGKSKYHVDGVGLLYFSDKLVVTTPKTIEDKQKFFTYLRKQHGDNFFFDKASVNHQSLQTIYNQDFQRYLEECKEKGVEPGEFVIPGLAVPTSKRTINLRKDKKK